MALGETHEDEILSKENYTEAELEEEVTLLRKQRGDFFEEEPEEGDDDDEVIDDEDSENDEPEEPTESDEFDDEEDGDDEDSPEEEEPTRSSEPRIPKHRLDEVIAQREAERERSTALEDQLRQAMSMLQKQLEATELQKPAATTEPEVDLDALEADLDDAIIMADHERAKALRQQIKREERRQLQAELTQLKEDARKEAEAAAGKIQEEAAFNATITSMEAKYPFLDQKSPEHNKQAVAKVNDIMTKFMAAGAPGPEALTEAVELIAPLYAGETKPRSKPKKEALGKKGERRSRQVKTNVDTQGKQPPHMQGKSTTDKDIKEYDVSKMTEDEFNALPSTVKRELRGD